ncbi:MAG: MATE family efflux transporter [Propionibacteriaceae bacterium]|nr:MATE family efflux transporter [Propionibacteriaceae bacterium]
MSEPSARSLDREILALALPSLATLLAEPLLTMADAAIVGHLSTPDLAGLGVGANISTTLVSLSIFLAYGTTGQVARRLGAGKRSSALRSGLDGIVLGLLIGIALLAFVELCSGWLISLYRPDASVASAAHLYLSMLALGLPAALVMLSATGVLRGLQDTKTPLVVSVSMNLLNIALTLGLVFGLRLGITGAAIGTVSAQTLAAVALVWRVLASSGEATNSILSRRWGRSRNCARDDEMGKSGTTRPDGEENWLRGYRPNPGAILAQAKTGGWLFLRSLGLNTAIVLTTGVAARMGASALAAHQVLNSLWSFMTYAMDAVAIAAQAMIGRYLGAGESAVVRRLMKRMLGYGVAIGLAVGLLVWAASGLYAPVFTPDPAVQALVRATVVVFALVTPVSGVVFVLDGVLIGAGDARYLALAQVINLVSYLPLLWAVTHFQADLTWLWLAYCGFMLSRMVTLSVRAAGSKWMRLGA